MRKVILLTSFLFLFGACTKNDITINPDNLLPGTWIYDKSDGNSYSFYRSSSFIDNHCYKFNSNGTLIERKNSGWCGTPPISYSDYPGTWSTISDSEIEINVGYWGGETSYNMNILLVNSDSLKVIIKLLN